LYVVLFHFFSPLPLTSPAMCFLGHGYLAVDIFFTLSGFVMALNYVGLFSGGVRTATVRTFFSRRFARIYPLYLVTLLIATALVAGGHLDFSGRSVAQAFPANLFMVQNWGNWESIENPAWSISTEWFAYLLFPFLVRWIFFRLRAVAIVLGLFSVGGLIWLSLNFSNPYDHTKILDLTHGYISLIRCVSEFTLGMLVYRMRDTRLGAKLKRLPWLALCAVVVLVVLLSIRKADLAVVLFVPLLIVALDGEKNVVSQFLGSRAPEFLGLISFSVYLLHYLFVPLLNRLDGYVHGTGRHHSHTYAAAVVFPLLLVCATATYYAVEVPARRGLRKLFEGNGRATPSLGQPAVKS
jgi:peptidoglycan/LPS O-acetylase OafA/YrhL